MLKTTDSDSGKVTDILRIHQMLRMRLAPIRRKMLRNYRYVVGDQIDPDIMTQLEKDNRPAMILNLLHPVVLSVSGHLSANRTKMQAVPVRMGDEAGAELHNVLVNDWAIGDNGYYEIGKAAVDAIIGKIGWVNTFMDYTQNPEGEWRTRCTDPFMMLWDPEGKQIDQSDWRYEEFTGWYSAEEIIFAMNLDPDKAEMVRERARILEGQYREGRQTPVAWWEKVRDNLLDFVEDGSSLRNNQEGLISDVLDMRNGRYRTIEFHDRRDVMSRWVYSPMTRDKEQIPPDKLNERNYISWVMEKYPKAMLQDVSEQQFWITTVAPGLLPETCLLERPYVTQQRGFQFKPIFCYDFHPDLTQTKAIIDDLIYPQDSVNQREMSMLQWLLETINPHIDAPKDSISPEDMQAWTSRERGQVRFFNLTGQSALKPEPRKPDAQAVDVMRMLSETNKDMITLISGVSPNFQGRSDTSKESGVLFSQRVQASLVNLAYVTIHVQRAMANIFSYTDRSLQLMLTTPRAVRILGEPPEGMEGIMLTKQQQDFYWLMVNQQTLDGVMNDLSQGEYDFRPDPRQLGATMKQLKWIEGMELAKVVPPDLMPWHMLIELWDMPTAKKIAEYVRRRLEAADMLHAQQQQMQQAQLAGDIFKGLAGKQPANQGDPAAQAQRRAQLTM